MLERSLTRWLRYWHGRSDVDYQHDYFRCHGCRRVVTWRAIKTGGCDCRMSNKLSPARLRWYEKVRLLCLPWWCIR